MCAVNTAKWVYRLKRNHLHCRKVNLPEDYLELIPLYCTAQLVLRIKHVIRRISARVFRENDIVFQSIDQIEAYDGLKLWNERIDLYFYCRILVYKLSLLICRLTIHRWKKKDMTEGVHEARNSMMQIMTLKATTRGTLWIDVVLKLRDFPANYISNCSIRSRFFTNHFFFKCHFKNPCFQLPQNRP